MKLGRAELKHCGDWTFTEVVGVFIQRNGTIEWNDRMERWNGMEWNGHTHKMGVFDKLIRSYSTLNRLSWGSCYGTVDSTSLISSWVEATPHALSQPAFYIQRCGIGGSGDETMAICIYTIRSLIYIKYTRLASYSTWCSLIGITSTHKACWGRERPGPRDY